MTFLCPQTAVTCLQTPWGRQVGRILEANLSGEITVKAISSVSPDNSVGCGCSRDRVKESRRQSRRVVGKDECNIAKFAVNLYIWSDPSSKTLITFCGNKTRTFDAFLKFLSSSNIVSFLSPSHWQSNNPCLFTPQL